MIPYPYEGGEDTKIQTPTEAQRAAKEFGFSQPPGFMPSELSCSKCGSIDRLNLKNEALPAWMVGRWFDVHAECIEENRRE